MALDFPASPTNGQIYEQYVYDSALPGWRSKGGAVAATYVSDTAPSGAVKGDMWYRSSDGTTYVFVVDANSSQWVEIRSEISTAQVGLVPVVPTSVAVGSGSASVGATGTITFTNATSISLNSVFSSSYRHYRFIIDTPTTSGNGSLTLRFRNGTTDDAVNTYFQYWTMKRLTGAIQDNTGGPSTSYSLYNFLTSSGSPTNSWSGDIIFPNVATTQTWITGQGFGYDVTSTYMINSSVLYNTAKSFDGLSIFSSAQLTGTVKVYGYN